MWLEGAVQNKWSVPQMRTARWEATGALEEQRPQAGDVVDADWDEDAPPPEIGAAGRMTTISDVGDDFGPAAVADTWDGDAPVAEPQASDDDDSEDQVARDCRAGSAAGQFADGAGRFGRRLRSVQGGDYQAQAKRLARCVARRRSRPHPRLASAGRGAERRVVCIDGSHDDGPHSMSDDLPIIGILTVSDRASGGVYEDRGGPAIRDYLTEVLATPWRASPRVMPDERDEIAAALVDMADRAGCCLIVTTGGTGPAPRDVTPEATLDVCDKELPGFGELMRKVFAGKSADCHPVASKPPAFAEHA